MDWCVAGKYGDANHHPEVQIEGALERTVSSGEIVRLSARGTRDPDGDDISFQWWQYREAGTYDGFVEIDDPHNMTTGFKAPEVSEPSTIHMILKVRDNGIPSLTSYIRVIIKVTP